MGKTIPSFPKFSKVYSIDNQLMYGELEGSGIWDLSLIKSSQAKQFVEIQTEKLWNKRASRTFNEPIWIIFEESEAYLKNIRGDASENVYRLVHLGRNQAIRCILVTTDLSLLDASVIRLCGIRFHGNLGIEENGKRKFRAYYGKDWTKTATEDLELGDFIKLHKNRLEVIHTWDFIRKNCPQQAFNFVEEKPIPQIQQPKKSWLSRFISFH